jgi:hypothetical protein
MFGDSSNLAQYMARQIEARNAASAAEPLHHFTTGAAVMICAADDMFAYADGWRGKVAGFNMGLAEVRIPHSDPDGPACGFVTLFVPPSQLAPTVAFGIEGPGDNL